MRNFTLRKSGKSLFLFAFFLISGTYSYGQTCPTVEDQDPATTTNEQFFCDSSTPEVQDLKTSAGAVWYVDQNSTQPLPPTQLLASGTTYYAGTDPASCAGTREAVQVTIFNQPKILGIKENSKSATKQSLPFIPFCVSDVNDPNVFLSDIRTSADATGTIQWYDSQNGGTQLPADTELVNGQTYWVDQGNPFGDCRTNRTGVTIRLYSEPAPTGDASQVFCAANNPTLADIVASGENRYFVSPTSPTELGASTPLEDGETYYIAAVGENCVSTDRLAVTVTVTALETVPETQGFCSSDNATIGDLEPAGTVWYADTQFTTPLDPTTPLTSGTVYYSEIPEGECSTREVTAEIYPAANAGTATTLTVCSNDAPVTLFDEIEGNPDPGGSFPNLPEGVFDPAAYEPGEYSFTYTIAGNDFCPSAETPVDITVIAAPDAGADVAQTYCSAELADAEAFRAEFTAILETRETNGSLDPTIETLVEDFNAGKAGVYTTKYTVIDTDSGCMDTASFSLTVNQTPNAGEDAVVQLIEGDTTVIDLFDALGGTPESGGTWSEGDGTFDPATDTAPASFTYTVTANNGCEASATVFVAEACPVVADTTPEFCAVISDGTTEDFPRVEDLLPAHAVWYTTANVDDDTTIDPSTRLEDGGIYFAGNASGTCTNRTAVTVTILESPNAGADTAVNVCANDAPFDLASRIEASIQGEAELTGSFSPALASGGTTFDPAIDTTGVYKYTVSSTTTCPDATSEITVTVEAVPEAPATTALEACATEGLTVADLSATPDSGNTITWYLDAELATPANATDVLVSGTYYATQTTSAGCESAATATNVVINDAPTPTAGEQASFCMIDEPTIAELAVNESGITWYDAATGGNVLNESEVLQNGMVYYASMTDTATGCESSQRLAITAVVEKCPLPLPEAFSPNGDGINDRFVVDFIAQQYPEFTIQIFNRWGQTVFQGDASNVAWDGTSSEGSIGSDIVPVGVYFYIIEYNDGETAPVQGTLYLSR